jgi:membrane associated rhomboid family serine protease
MFIPIRTDSPLRSTPYMNWALIVVNVLVWVAQAMGETRGPGGGQAPAWYYGYTLSALQPQLWHFVTYGFLHSGALHLIGNMLFLYIFGNNVNDKMGNVGYLAFYLASVVASGLAFVLWSPDGVPVLGASGAVAAVVGAYMILFPRASVTILALFIIIGTFEIPSLWFVLAFFAKDLIGLSGQSNVAHSAHVGGTLFGMAVCLALLGVHLLPRDQFDVLAMVKRWNRRRAYRDAVSGGWNPYGPTAAGGPPLAGPAAGRGDARGLPDPAAVSAAPLDPKQASLLALRGRVSDAVRDHDLPAAANLYVELKSLDPRQVLSRQIQLDIANQLASEQRYPQASEAYETFLQHYPKYEQTEQLELMLGLIQARFLSQPGRAREHLLRALAKLTDENARAMARTELAKIDAAGPAAGTGAAATVPGRPSVGGAG